MDVLQAVVNRRNIKQFKPDAIDEEQLIAWLESASYAPNHRMTEPWEIIVVGPEARAKLNHKANFGDAPVVIAVLSKREANQLDRDENVIAVSCFVQNFNLVAWEAGVGTRWASLGSKPENRAVLGISEDYDVIGILGVGYPADVPAVKHRTPIREKIKHVQ